MAPERAPITHKTLTWRVVMGVMQVLYTVVWPARVRGRENVPRTGRVLIVANHQSFLDIPLLAKGVGRRHVAFVARETLARSRVLGFVMRQAGTLLVDRDRGDRTALRRIAEQLEAEDAVAIFPEATRSADGRLGRPKKGALLAARKTGAPLVPCALIGTNRAWPRGARWPRPGRVEVHFAPPVASDAPDAFARAWRSVAAMLGQEPPDAAGDDETHPTQAAASATCDEPVPRNPR